jgi:hypothetical protein
VNRLRWLWKKHGPWVPGVTIDLGEHEATFLNELSALGWSPDEIAPRIIDRLRWKFRRTMIDRRDAARWHDAVADLADQVRAAGPRPDDQDGFSCPAPAFETPTRLSPHSRRRQLDQSPPTPVASGVTPAARAVQVEGHDGSELNLATLLVRHRQELAPILARCESAAERLRVATAFQRLGAEPDSPAAHRHWISVLQRLG